MSTQQPEMTEGEDLPPPSPDSENDFSDASDDGDDIESELSDGEVSEQDIEELDGLPPEVEESLLQELGRVDQATAFQRGGGMGAVATSLSAAVPVPDDPLDYDPSTMGLSRAEPAPPPRAPRQSGWGADPYAGAAPDHDDIVNIEDLYARYPQLGTGEFTLRVEREKPKIYGNKPCAGFLRDLNEPIDMAQFRRLFGGGTYLLNVMGKKKDRLGEGGQYQMRTIKRLRINISGAPLMLNSEEDMYNSGGRYPALGIDPSVQKTQLTIDAEQRQREERERERLANRLDREKEERFRIQTESSQAQVDAIRELSERSAAQLGHEIERLRRDLASTSEQARRKQDELERELKEKQEEIYRIRSEMVTAAQKEETERIIELKRHHETEISRLREAQNDKLQSLQEEARRREAEITDRAAMERRDKDERAERDRRALVEEHDRRLQFMQSQHEMSLRAQKESFEARIAEQERHARSEIQQIQNAYKMQIESIRTSERATATADTTAANGQLSFIRMQYEQAQAELARKEEQLEFYRREQMSGQKSVVETIQEAKGLLDAVGMGGDKAPEDFKAAAMRIASDLAGNLPEVIKGISTARAEGQAAAAQAAIEQQQAQRAIEARRAAMIEHQRRQNQGLPPPQMPPSQRIEHRPPPGMWDPSAGPGDPADGPGEPAASPMGHSGRTSGGGGVTPLGANHIPGPVHYIDPVHQYGLPPAAEQAPPQPPPQQQHVPPPQAQPQPPPMEVQHPVQHGPPVMVEEQQQPTHEPATPPPHEAATAPPPAPPSLPEAQEELEPEELPMLITGEMPEDLAEQIQLFLHTLNKTIDDGVYGPKTFARGVVAQLGPDRTRALVRMMSPDQVVEYCAADANATGAITTMDGREYLQKAWDEAIRLTAE